MKGFELGFALLKDIKDSIINLAKFAKRKNPYLGPSTNGGEGRETKSS